MSKYFVDIHENASTERIRERCKDEYNDSSLVIIKEIVTALVKYWMSSLDLNHSQMAKMMGISCATLRRVIDPGCMNISLSTLDKVVSRLGKTLHIQIV